MNANAMFEKIGFKKAKEEKQIINDVLESHVFTYIDEEETTYIEFDLIKKEFKAYTYHISSYEQLPIEMNIHLIEAVMQKAKELTWIL